VFVADAVLKQPLRVGALAGRGTSVAAPILVDPRDGSIPSVEVLKREAARASRILTSAFGRHQTAVFDFAQMDGFVIVVQQSGIVAPRVEAPSNIPAT
jgi:hypothetical protein